MMIAAARELNRHFVDLWKECDTSFPDLGPRYLPQAQTKNEQSLLKFLDQVDQVLASPPRSRDGAQAAKVRLAAAFRCLAEEVLGSEAAQLDLLPSQAFSGVSEEFVHKARAFDRRLSMEDIYQAGRNAWTAHGLQWLLGLPVQLTPSIFAYSLLYPYTDNYLDDTKIDRETKQSFNERFRQRLRGENLLGVDAQERTIFNLVEMIEGQYSRLENPAVFESLLAIHDAQSQSLSLLRGVSATGEVDVLGLSFYKGGTSVLADGYLAAGSLSGPQGQYAYGHGIFAQLVDDLEDVEEDRRAGRLTIYSQLPGDARLDELASRTFHFGQRVLRGLDSLKADEPVRELIRRGANLMLIEVIGRADRHFSPAYLGRLEAYSPFRFSILKEQRQEFVRRHGTLGKWMESLMLDEKF